MPRRTRPGQVLTALVILAIVFVIGCLMLWALWLATFWAIDRTVDWVPPSWEVALGDSVASDVGKDVDDPLVKDAVATIAGRLVAALPKASPAFADQPYTFIVKPIWAPEENAFAFPGGQVRITSGLLSHARSPDEVACVLGHEFVHVLHRHSFRGMAKKLGLTLILAMAFGDSGTIGATIAQGSEELIGLGFDRAQESDSDRVGVKLAYEAGFAPIAMSQLFKRQQSADTGAGAERALAFLSTHPANADRLAEIQAIAASLPPRRTTPDHLHASWPEVMARAAKIPAAYRVKKKSKKKKKKSSDDAGG